MRRYWLLLLLLMAATTLSARAAVIINELAPGVGGLNVAEFVELYNTGDTAVDLTGWKLCLRGKDSTGDTSVFNLSGSIPAQGYFLITGGGGSVNGTNNYNSKRTTFSPNLPLGDMEDTRTSNTATVGGMSANNAQIGLRDAGGNIVDGVGYCQSGSTFGNKTYVESNPVILSGFPSTSSLTRYSAHGDTGDNSIDFMITTTISPSSSGTVQPTPTPTATPTPTPTPTPVPSIVPYLTIAHDPSTTIYVNWWNPNATGDSTVDYGLTSAYGQQAKVATVTNYHHVELTGLTPGATYHYRISSSDGTTGEDNTFSLPETNDTDFTFCSSGDTRGNGGSDDYTLYIPRHKAIYDYIASKNPAFVINVGDLTNQGSNKTDYVNFFQAEANCLRRAPYMIAMGNHEVQGSGTWPTSYYFYNLFAPVYPANGTPGSSGQSTALGMNYSFDYGNAHFVFLSSYKMTAASQVTWLDNDLTAARANPNIKWLFAVMHAPLYTWVSGHPAEANELAAWGPIFDKHHVDIVFAGHNHIYERSYVINGNKVMSSDKPADGTIYMTTGLGGGPFNGSASADPSYPFIRTSYWQTTAASFVHIQGAKLTVDTYNVNNQLVDSFSIDKTAQVPVTLSELNAD